MSLVDAEAILAEYNRRPEGAGRRIARAGLGRRLDGGNVASLVSQPPSAAAAASTAHDTDAAMKWMESRIDALAAEVATENKPSSVLPSARRGGRSKLVTPRVRSNSTDSVDGSVAELIQLETRARDVTAKLRAEQRAIAALREQLPAAGSDDGGEAAAQSSASDADQLEQQQQQQQQQPPRPLASVRNVPGTSGAPSARGVVSVRPSARSDTSASDLADATARRAAALQRQLP